MNLRRVRSQLTAVYAVLSLIAVGFLAIIAIQTGGTQISDSAERAAESIMAEALQNDEPDNTWYVNITDEWVNADGETWVEPPPLTIGRGALWDGVTGHHFEQDGEWLIAALVVGDDEAIVGAGVDVLLEFARLEAGQAMPRLAPLRLDLLVEEVVASVRVDGVCVIATVEEPVVVLADYALLRQALDTVVRNATERAESVEVEASVEGRMERVIVADDGPGFPADLLEHVFDRFRRGDRKGSSGLGLAIALRIVEVHGGQMTADNGTVGAVAAIEVPVSAQIDR